MPPPSKIAIATSSLRRLVKEEESYYRELEWQHARVVTARIEKLKRPIGAPPDENAEYLVQQELRGIEETKKVFPGLIEKIKNAIERLKTQIEEDEPNEDLLEQVEAAKEAVTNAETVLRSRAKEAAEDAESEPEDEPATVNETQTLPVQAEKPDDEPGAETRATEATEAKSSA